MTAAERQDQRRKKLIREDPEKYANCLLKQKALMQRKRENMSELQIAERKSKENQGRQEIREIKEQKQKLVGSPQAYAAESSLNRVVNRINSHLPKSPRKQKAVVKELACKVKLNFP